MNVGILRHFRWLAVAGLGLLVLANSAVTWTKVSDLVEAQAPARSERSEASARVAFLTIAAATFGNLLLLTGVYCLAVREIRRSRRDAAQIRDSQQRLQLVLDNIPQRIFWKDLESRFVGCNQAFASDFGAASPEELVGRTDYDIQPAHTASAFRADDKEVMTLGQQKVGYEEPLIRPDGDTAWLRTSKIPLRGPDGEVIGLLGTYEDITERKRVECDLRLRDRAVEASVNAIFITDHRAADEPIVYVNPAFERITGYGAAEAIGRNCRFLQGEDHEQPGVRHIREAIRALRPDQAVLRNYRKDGTMFWNELRIAPVSSPGGEVTHFVGILQDVTETKRYQEQLEHQATHDTLTGLPNRSLLLDRLNRAILQAKRDSRSVTVAFLDLDGFKNVNDGMGHAAGDRLLEVVARRLEQCVRSTDTVARLGGDEFVLVLGAQERSSTTASELQRVLDAVSRPLQLDGRELYVTASLGASVYPRDGEDAESLLQNADTAMYRAKDLGRNTFQSYSGEMNQQLDRRLALLARLRHGVERKEFTLHYQPRVDLRSGRIVGVEALVRWQHPQLGMVSPADFIPLAEESGLIEPIGDWVLRTACLQAKAWRDMGLAPIQMAVNLSARQFRRPGLAAWIAQTLHETQLRGEWLELELTESLLMQDADGAERTMRQIKDLGVSLAIDDFGTGYSSLSYLKRFPVDHLKIDRTFVRDLPAATGDAAIARTVIALGQILSMQVIAEGVETREQAVFLRDEGCDEIQGFYFSRPLSAQACGALLASEVSLDLRPQGVDAAGIRAPQSAVA